MSAKLVFRNIKLLISKRPFRFIVIILGQIFAAFCVLAVYGIAVNSISVYEVKSEYQEFKDKYFSFDFPTSQGKVECDEKIQRFMLDYSNMVKKFELDGSFVDNDTRRGFFVYEDFNESAQIPASSIEEGLVTFDKAIGDTVSIQGREYTVTKKANTGTDYVLDYSFRYSSFPDECRLLSFGVTLKSEPTTMQAKEIRHRLCEIFSVPEDSINAPKGVNLQDKQYNSVALAICFGISMTVIFCISLIYMYEIEQRQRSIAIFSYCGCSKTNALNMLLYEILVLLFISFALALVTFLFAGIPFIEKVIDNYSDFYSPLVIVAIFGMYILLSILIFAVSIADLINKTAVEIERRA